MNKILFNTVFSLALIIGTLNFTSCEDDDEKEKVPATIEFKDNDEYDNNHPNFWCPSEPKDKNLILIYSWYFSNGELSSDSSYSPTFNFPDTYLIQLTVTTSEGVSDVDTMTYEVKEINPELIENPYLNNLCLNPGNIDTKEWVLSSAEGHMSVGPSAGIDNGTGADWINDPIVENHIFPANYLVDSTDASLAYRNAMSFTLERFVYKHVDTTDWVANWYFANEEFGYNQAEGNDICLNVTTGLDTAGYFSLEEYDDETVFIELSGKNFLLYYEGKPSKTKYQVLALYNDLLLIRKLYFNAEGYPAGYRYLRYVPKGNGSLDLPNEDNRSILNPPSEH